MARLKKGMTLLELLIAMALITMVLATASALLISFQKFYSGFMQKQENMSDVSLAALEEIAGKITIANSVKNVVGSWTLNGAPLQGSGLILPCYIVDSLGSPSLYQSSLSLGQPPAHTPPGWRDFYLEYYSHITDFIKAANQIAIDRGVPLVIDNTIPALPVTYADLFTNVTEAFAYACPLPPSSVVLYYHVVVGGQTYDMSYTIPVSSTSNTTCTNVATAGGMKFVIKVDESNTPTDPTDDVTYTYWVEGSNLKRGISSGGSNSEDTIAKNIQSLTFAVGPDNQVKINISAKLPEGTTEAFETTVTARCAHS